MICGNNLSHDVIRDQSHVISIVNFLTCVQSNGMILDNFFYNCLGHGFIPVSKDFRLVMAPKFRLILGIGPEEKHCDGMISEV